MNVGRIAISLLVFVVVAAIAFGGWYLVSNVFLEGGRQEREAAAAKALKDQGVLVIIEPGTKRVSTVNFCGKPVTEEQVLLLKDLHRLGVLMANGSEVPPSFMDVVSQVGSVNSLALSDTEVRGEALDKIGQMSNLDSLSLKNVHVTDENLDAISSLTNVKILDLSDTDITDAGLVKLSSMKGVHWLLLSGTKVTDNGASELSKMELKRLTLLDTAVTDEAIKQLQELLPNMKVDSGARPAEEKTPEEKTPEGEPAQAADSGE